jgi:murein DD-endopeptidase MepM/ murein hydrolase activator NlpD
VVHSVAWSVLAAGLLNACGEIREASQRLLDRRSPRERYEASLAAAGLTRTAVARDWVSAAERALRDAPLVSTPHVEDGYLAPAEPSAISFRINVRRGQQVAFSVQLPNDASTLLFLDAWQLEPEPELSFRRVAAADSGVRVLTIEPRRDGELIFRAQPELLRGGRFKALLQVGPTLSFPVKGGGERDIGSRFGAPRDAGARDHHGVDIFAPRGTPALAAAEATVTRVQTTPRGGNVVWLRDARGNSLYYAHLDRQRVDPGSRVVPGDTIGFVGNTGNARTTPPHLHFGVYRRGEGPVDPFWFLHRPRGTAPRLVADTALLGEWARTPRDRTLLRSAPDVRADTALVLEGQTAIRVLSAVGGWYRVRLPDGMTGYVVARAAESARTAVRSARLEYPAPLLARPLVTPSPDDVIANVTAGEPVAIFARFGSHLLVRGPDGAAGWIAQ